MTAAPSFIAIGRSIKMGLAIIALIKSRVVQGSISEVEIKVNAFLSAHQLAWSYLQCAEYLSKFFGAWWVLQVLHNLHLGAAFF
ncbi:MAG: hypothetical protein CM15mP68_1100 [Pseudomonadota bacterium]|nr:MAG: hypothetical protein CM15mP68_1100 [Pseudomonadota bacterium]